MSIASSDGGLLRCPLVRSVGTTIAEILSQLSARMRAVSGSMTELSEWGGCDAGLKARADLDTARAKGPFSRYSGRRAHQRDCRTMANKLGQLRVVPKPQREHVAVATEDDGFPPPVVEGFLGDDEMPRRDLVPGPR